MTKEARAGHVLSPGDLDLSAWGSDSTSSRPGHCVFRRTSPSEEMLIKQQEAGSSHWPVEEQETPQGWLPGAEQVGRCDQGPALCEPHPRPAGSPASPQCWQRLGLPNSG